MQDIATGKVLEVDTCEGGRFNAGVGMVKGAGICAGAGVEVGEGIGELIGAGIGCSMTDGGAIFFVKTYKNTPALNATIAMIKKIKIGANPFRFINLTITENSL